MTDSKVMSDIQLSVFSFGIAELSNTVTVPGECPRVMAAFRFGIPTLLRRLASFSLAYWAYFSLAYWAYFSLAYWAYFSLAYWAYFCSGNGNNDDGTSKTHSSCRDYGNSDCFHDGMSRIIIVLAATTIRNEQDQ